MRRREIPFSPCWSTMRMPTLILLKFSSHAMMFDAMPESLLKRRGLASARCVASLLRFIVIANTYLYKPAIRHYAPREADAGDIWNMRKHSPSPITPRDFAARRARRRRRVAMASDARSMSRDRRRAASPAGAADAIGALMRAEAGHFRRRTSHAATYHVSILSISP